MALNHVGSDGNDKDYHHNIHLTQNIQEDWFPGPSAVKQGSGDLVHVLLEPAENSASVSDVIKKRKHKIGIYIFSV